MTISKTRRTAISAAIGTAVTIAMSTMAFAPAFATPVAPAGPTVVWDTQITDGTHYLWGQVPAVGTCTASSTEADVVVSECAVAGDGTDLAAVGQHVVTASATATLGDVSTPTTLTRTYFVDGYTFKGFYKPVKMGVQNKIKGGSTVPLKFKVYLGAKKVTSKTVVASILAQQVDCTLATPIGAPTSVTSTGKGLKLKYNDGAFHQNWKSPKLAVTKVKGKKVVLSACYQVTVNTQDGSSLAASFLLK